MMLGDMQYEMEWRDYSLCAKISDRSDFFAEDDEEERLEEARKVCRACAVMLECRDIASAKNEIHHVWGGRSSAERKRDRRFWNSNKAVLFAEIEDSVDLIAQEIAYAESSLLELQRSGGQVVALSGTRAG